jgi:hypothetical protein
MNYGKFQIPNKSQVSIANDRNDFDWNFGFWTLELVCGLACLREAASAKAGAWNLMLRSRAQ